MNKIDTLLNTDPVAIAEDIGRVGNLKSADSGMLLLALSIAHGAVLTDALEETDDTTFSNKLVNYQRIIVSMGFELVLSTPFVGRSWNGDPAPNEVQYIYAHRDGLLLIFDTYYSDSVNSAKVYYAHRAHSSEGRRYNTSHYSSGGYYSAVEWRDKTPADIWWFGDHDARVALRHTINRLREGGQFLTPWPKPHEHRSYHVWMCHYMDHKSLDNYGSPEYEATIAKANARLHQLPDWVKEMIATVLPTQK